MYKRQVIDHVHFVFVDVSVKSDIIAVIHNRSPHLVNVNLAILQRIVYPLNGASERFSAQMRMLLTTL